MKQISLTQGQVALVDDADYDWLNQYKWHAQKDYRSDSYYAVRYFRLSVGKYSQISINGKVKNLGSWDIEEVAALRYDMVAIREHGEFAHLNF